jgi:hypothetical protein
MRKQGGVLFVAVCLVLQAPCFADDQPTGGSSSSSSYFRGYGGTASNVFAPRYKERLANFAAQIDNGAAKGWLTPTEAETFRNQVFALTALEQEVSQKGFPKDDLDDMEKRFNELNVRLSQTMSKGTPPPPPVTTDGATPPAGASDKPTDPAAAKPTAAAAGAAKPTPAAAKQAAAASKKSTTAKTKATSKSKPAAKKKVVVKTSTTKKKLERP